MKKNRKRILSLLLSLVMLLGLTVTTALAADLDPEGKLTVWLKDGVVVAPETEGATAVEVDRIVSSKEDNISSFSGGGWTTEDDDYAFITALYVKDGKVVADLSVADARTGEVSDVVAKGVTIQSTYEGFNPIIVVDSDYTIQDADITIDSDGDGSLTCDFSGLGAAVAVYGDSTVLILDSAIQVSGVANLAVFADDGADVVIKNSTLHSDGGTLYSDYLNSPNQATMVAPPWILGIMGTSRATNLMGTDSSTTVIDSDVSAAQWAVLSTDSGSNMYLNVVNSNMSLTGAEYDLQETNSDGVTFYQSKNPFTDRSGYGTYVIGGAVEKFYGVTMDVGTYGSIFTGGTGVYTNLEAGKTYDLYNAKGEVIESYTAAEDKVTTINSDTFGFMSHQGEDWITIENGTVVNSDYASLLLKNTQGATEMNITSGAQLNPGNGVLLQMMDNDDSLTGMDMETFSFYTEYFEDAGWPSETGNISSEMPKDENAGGGGPGGPGGAPEGEGAPPEGGGMMPMPSGPVTNEFNATDVTLTGDIYNGTGYYGQDAVKLDVNLGKGASLTGIIAATETVHINENGSSKVVAEGTPVSNQNTYFTISEYYYIGHVGNRYFYNGDNDINVTLTDDAKWALTGDSVVTDLTANSDAITAAEPVTLTVHGTLTLDGETVTGTKTVGNVTYVVVEHEEEPAPEEPAPEEPAPEEPAPEEPAPETPVEPEVSEYTVVSGDSLWKIAQKVYGTGTKWDVIYEANKETVKDPGMIYVGQKLIIP